MTWPRGTPEAFEAAMIRRAEALAGSVEFDAMLEAKRAARAADEAEKPLADYRAEELARMRLNFFGFDTSYHVARLNFITAVPKSRTPLHLARHRRKARAASRRSRRAQGLGSELLDPPRGARRQEKPRGQRAPLGAMGQRHHQAIHPAQRDDQDTTAQNQFPISPSGPTSATVVAAIPSIMQAQT
jgi:hypothetical protein